MLPNSFGKSPGQERDGTRQEETNNQCLVTHRTECCRKPRQTRLALVLGEKGKAGYSVQRGGTLFSSTTAAAERDCLPYRVNSSPGHGASKAAEEPTDLPSHCGPLTIPITFLCLLLRHSVVPHEAALTMCIPSAKNGCLSSRTVSPISTWLRPV